MQFQVEMCVEEQKMFQIYMMSFIMKIDADELHQIWKESGRVLGDFKEYKIRFSELEEAYGKMKGIKNKPDFIEVYNCVSDIVHMFEI